MKTTRTMKAKVLFSLAISLALTSCNHKSGRGLTDISYVTVDAEDEVVNPIEQALPIIMILPSDQLLEKYGAATQSSDHGNTSLSRDYTKYLLDNPDNKTIVSYFQDAFVKLNYPLSDLEQTLKSLQSNKAMDMADNLQKDPKTLLLATASPDIILELDYTYQIDINSRNLRRELNYTVRAIDAYTNKVFSTHSYSSHDGESLTEVLGNSMKKAMEELSKEINAYFADIVYKGREITLRIAVENGSNIKLSDESIEGDTYADWAISYVKTKAKKGAYNMQVNTDNELKFVNVRIPILNVDGTQFSAYDWGKDLGTAMRKELGVKTTNKTQGLGNILITVKGIK